MHSYRVSFYFNGKSPEGKTVRDYLGSNVVDMKPNDALDLHTKAFRQAAPNQQIANELKVVDLGPWGSKRSAQTQIQQEQGAKSRNFDKRHGNEFKKRTPTQVAKDNIEKLNDRDTKSGRTWLPKREDNSRHGGKERFKGRSGSVAK